MVGSSAGQESNDPTRDIKHLFITTLGNSKDYFTLLQMLQEEKDVDVLVHIITVLGAMGEKDVIPHLLRMVENRHDKKLQNCAQQAIDSIERLSRY